MCAPKTLKCALGTKPGKVTKLCELVPHAPKRCPAGSRRNKTGNCENDFIKLCEKHIMVSTLDEVVQTSVLSNKNCTIFLIGEKHAPYKKCTEILEMFKALIRENEALPKPIKIDIMIEYLQSTFSNSVIIKDTLTTQKKYNGQQLIPYKDTYVQLNNVRDHFQDCMETRNCSARLHWTDPTNTLYTKEKSEKNIHEWLRELEHSTREHGVYNTTWLLNPKITNFFNQESDIPKLLTENRIAVKEIQKASRINKHFTMDFCIKIFMQFYSDMRKTSDWPRLVTMQNRFVVDFYNVARIIKLKMNHVICYAGFAHTRNMTVILSELNFNIVRKVDGTCLSN
jgi:hypothetical protein